VAQDEIITAVMRLTDELGLKVGDRYPVTTVQKHFKGRYEKLDVRAAIDDMLGRRWAETDGLGFNLTKAGDEERARRRG